MITEVTKDNFQAEVVESKVPVLLDFWAPWCGHCLNLMPTVEEIAAEKEGEIKVCKVNIDDEPELAMKFGVMSIPTCVKLEGGELKNKTLGALPKEALLSQLGF